MSVMCTREGGPEPVWPASSQMLEYNAKNSIAPNLVYSAHNLRKHTRGEKLRYRTDDLIISLSLLHSSNSGAGRRCFLVAACRVAPGRIP